MEVSDHPYRPVFYIDVAPSLAEYLEPAAARLSYMEDAFSLEIEQCRVKASVKTEVTKGEVERKLNHALYREKIRSESAELRGRFLQMMIET